MIKSNNKGFTLIEAIASLFLMGIVALIAGLGIVQGVKAYALTRMSSETIQRAEYALNRMKLEFMNMDKISAADANSITFTSNTTERFAITDTPLIINHTGTQINLSVNGSANPLLTGLSASAPFLSYLKSGGTAWALADKFNTLHTIIIQIIIPRPDGRGNLTFTTAVNPRNNGLANIP
jgi:prepilin-type N-terminal cleavage/methylation domain-containing protein